MKRFIAAAALTSLVLFPLFGYVYFQGMIDGVARYRGSRQFQLTLFSMYRFGVLDACADHDLCQKIK